MNQTKHTPGPWKRGNLTTNDGQAPILGEDGRIALVDGRDDDIPARSRHTAPDPEREANVRLIAAAPDLLEIVRRYVACNAGGTHLHEAAMVVLAKATGTQ